MRETYTEADVHPDHLSVAGDAADQVEAANGQRSARNNEEMRDGNNSHGSPEFDSGSDATTDRDVGDTAPVPEELEDEEAGVLDAVPAVMDATAPVAAEIDARGTDVVPGRTDAEDEGAGAFAAVVGEAGPGDDDDDGTDGGVGDAADAGDVNEGTAEATLFDGLGDDRADEPADARPVAAVDRRTGEGDGPAGASPKRQAEYRGLVHEFEEEGRYPGREEEVAARIVNKQRREFGETQESQAREDRGEAPDRHLPIEGYQHLTVPQVVQKLGDLSPAEVNKVRAYEQTHRRRKTLLAQLERRLHTDRPHDSGEKHQTRPSTRPGGAGGRRTKS